MDYFLIKAVHQTAVALSISGFLIRGLATLANARWVQGRAAKTIPHVVDTVLLLSAVTLVWMLRLPPLATPWLMAKIAGLLVYVAFGMVALRPSLPVALRSMAGVAALVTVGWIVSVAITKDPFGFFGRG
jgi:uncharacterized membrane protein SirB2